jgi:hypothetical protein
VSERWFDAYDDQTTDELLALESDYRIDSLVAAFEQALYQKAGKLSAAERYILAVEALEREVNNGGYDQFFLNSSHDFIDVIAEALKAVGCPKTAAMTGDAIRALGLGDSPTGEEAEAAVLAETPEVKAALSACDDRYFASDEPIADRLFAWIKENREQVRIGR